MENEILNVIDYKDSDRFKKIKANIWKLAKSGKPFEIGDDATATEYRYFHKLYLLYLDVASGLISNDQAQSADKNNYMKFEFDQKTWENYIFSQIEWNENIKKSNSARVKICKAKTSAELVDGVIECIEALTGDKTLRNKIETLKGDKT